MFNTTNFLIRHKFLNNLHIRLLVVELGQKKLSFLYRYLEKKIEMKCRLAFIFLLGIGESNLYNLDPKTNALPIKLIPKELEFN